MILQTILAFEAFIALGAIVDLVIVHDLMLLQSNECWEDLETDIADLR
jgi:hypothetical protein